MAGQYVHVKMSSIIKVGVVMSSDSWDPLCYLLMHTPWPEATPMPASEDEGGAETVGLGSQALPRFLEEHVPEYAEWCFGHAVGLKCFEFDDSCSHDSGDSEEDAPLPKELLDEATIVFVHDIPAQKRAEVALIPQPEAFELKVRGGDDLQARSGKPFDALRAQAKVAPRQRFVAFLKCRKR